MGRIIPPPAKEEGFPSGNRMYPDERVVGGIIKVTAVKCKMSRSQGREEIFYIRWGEGIDNVRTIMEIATAHGIIKKGGAGWMTWESCPSGPLKLQGVEKVDGKKVFAVRMTPKKGDADTFYFDAVTGLVAGVASTAEMQGQEVKTRVLFRGYKAVDGVQIPHTLELEEPASARFTIRLESVKHNVKPDSKWFKKAK